MPRLRVLVGLLVLGRAASSAAQCTPGGPSAPAARPGAMVGIVMDTAHHVIEGAGIWIKDSAERVQSGADGRFVIGNLRPGTYELSVRRFGYEVDVGEYQVTARGGVARICLVPRMMRLIPVVTSATRLGLFGIVGDSMYHPLPDAEVRVMAAHERAMTDSAGAFTIGLKPGTYALVVTKPGFGEQLLSVTIPKDSGRQVAIWLGSVPRNLNRMAAAYFDLRMRLETANANRSALKSAEDLAQTSVDLRFAIQAAIGVSVGGLCKAIVDGGPFMLPLEAIDKDDVAMVEVYLAKAPRSGVTSINGTARGAKILSTVPPRPQTCGLLDIYVWMK